MNYQYFLKLNITLGFQNKKIKKHFQLYNIFIYQFLYPQQIQVGFGK